MTRIHPFALLRLAMLLCAMVFGAVGAAGAGEAAPAAEDPALEARLMEITAELRSCHVSQPLLLMGYYNPILAYGVERFVRQAVSAGVDGFIIPDLPPEEAADLEAACRLRQCALVYLLAPTSTPERTATITAHTSGFLYLVSVVGVTGRRESLATDLEPFLNRARRAANVPVAVGFGISTPDQAQTVGRLADGVIVGSALIEAVSGSARRRAGPRPSSWT